MRKKWRNWKKKKVNQLEKKYSEKVMSENRESKVRKWSERVKRKASNSSLRMLSISFS